MKLLISIIITLSMCFSSISILASQPVRVAVIHQCYPPGDECGYQKCCGTTDGNRCENVDKCEKDPVKKDEVAGVLKLLNGKMLATWRQCESSSACGDEHHCCEIGGGESRCYPNSTACP